MLPIGSLGALVAEHPEVLLGFVLSRFALWLAGESTSRPNLEEQESGE